MMEALGLGDMSDKRSGVNSCLKRRKIQKKTEAFMAGKEVRNFGMPSVSKELNGSILRIIR
jgi:hypothetical protein